MKYLAPFLWVVMLISGNACCADAPPANSAPKDKEVVGKIVKLADVKDDIVGNIVQPKAAYKLKASGTLASQIEKLNGHQALVKGTLDGEVLTVVSVAAAPATPKAPPKKN